MPLCTKSWLQVFACNSRSHFFLDETTLSHIALSSVLIECAESEVGCLVNSELACVEFRIVLWNRTVGGVSYHS